METLMRTRSLLAALLLFPALAPASELKVAMPEIECRWSGNDMQARKLDILIAAEGYTLAELPKFQEHADRAMGDLIVTEPFTTYAGFFRIWYVYTVSEKSFHAPTTDNEEHGTCFNTFLGAPAGASERRLLNYGLGGEANVKLLRKHFQEWRGLPPSGVLVVVLANSQQYGGGAGVGDLQCRTTACPDMLRILPHEVGHALASLSDEYPGRCLAWPPPRRPLPTLGLNISTHPDNPVWSAWMGVRDKWMDPKVFRNGKWDSGESFESVVGTFEGGGGDYAAGLWRPTELGCRMRSQRNIYRYCRVCNELMIRSLYKYADFATAWGSEEMPDGSGWLAWVDVAVPRDTAYVVWSNETSGGISTWVCTSETGGDRRVRYMKRYCNADRDKPVRALVADFTKSVRMDLEGTTFYYQTIEITPPTFSPK